MKSFLFQIVTAKNRSGEDVHAKAGIENLEKTIDLETKNHDFQT